MPAIDRAGSPITPMPVADRASSSGDGVDVPVSNSPIRPESILGVSPISVAGSSIISVAGSSVASSGKKKRGRSLPAKITTADVLTIDLDTGGIGDSKNKPRGRPPGANNTSKPKPT